MKTLAIAFAAAAFLAVPAIGFAANEKHSTSISVVSDQDQEKKEVDINDLPQEINAALKGPDHMGWLPKQAWKVKTDDGWIYKVKLMKGEETKKVKFTKDGKQLKDMKS